MRNLVIIGNGFDLFHGIKSSYWDFKEYLEKIGEDEFIRTLERYISSDELWSSFECALGNLDYEAVKENNSCYLLGYGDEDWSDSAHHDYQMMISEELSFSENISAYLKKWIFRSTYKNVDNIIQYNASFFSELRGIGTVYIIGHSLADVDLQYFSVLLNGLGDNVNWVVTYHKECEKEDFIVSLLDIGIQRKNIHMSRAEQLCHNGCLYKAF